MRRGSIHDPKASDSEATKSSQFASELVADSGVRSDRFDRHPDLALRCRMKPAHGLAGLRREDELTLPWHLFLAEDLIQAVALATVQALQSPAYV